MNNKIAIIGAGLTGLSLAHHLKKFNIEFVIYECKDRVGGAIRTEHKDGFMFENGPSTGLVGSPEMAELMEELNCQIDYADNAAKSRWIYKNNKWRELPNGILSGISTPLFSFADKIRLLGEPFRRPGKNPNETLANLVRRRMGKSFLKYAVDPFILGIYSGNPETLVTKYAMPKLYNLEQNYGSFIGGSIKKSREPKTEQELKATRQTFSFANGLSELIDALEKELANHIVLNASNISVKPVADELYELRHDGMEQAKKFNTVVSTIGGWALPDLLSFLPKERLAPILKLEYAKVVQVSVGFKEWKGKPLNAFGGLIPFSEKRDVLGALFLSSFLQNRCPEGGALLSVFIGGVRRPELTELDDQAIEELVKRELMELFEIEEWNANLFEIRRHEHAIPQYGIESEEKLAAIESIEEEFPGLILAGNIRDGISMSDRTTQASTIAQQLTHTTPMGSTGLRTHT